MSKLYHIDEWKLEEIVELIEECNIELPKAMIKEELLTDCNDNEHPQAWLDTATVREIASWVVQLYGEVLS